MKIKTAFFLILGLLTLTGCSTLKTKRLILAHGLDTQHSVHKAMVFMSERLSDLSGGKLTIDVYPSQQLGTERQCLELLQIGSVDMTKVSSGVMEGFAPVFKIMSIPYIFQSREHCFRVLDSYLGEDLLKQGESFMLKGLCFYDSGSRSFYTKERPINEPADLKGLKIRVMSSPTSIDMIKTMGGAATPISWGELYTALQGGVVDGAENNPPSFYLSHHYEVCKYYSLDEHTTIPDMVLISTHTWNRLSEQEKKWLTQAAKESVEYQRTLWLESEQEALKAVQEAGVKVSFPDKTPFIEILKPLRDSYKQDSVIRRWIEDIEKMGDDL